jgi:WD40 repeat protein
MQHTKDVVEVHRHSQGSQESGEATMSIQFTPDYEWVAAASSTGAVQFTSRTHSAMFRPFGLGDRDSGLTNICFCKDYDDEGDNNSYWMSASSSSGLVRVFQVVPEKMYKSLGEAREEGNETLVTALSQDHHLVATGGSDKVLRVYVVTPDDGIRLTQQFEQGIDEHGAPSVGHGSRIFAIKFLPDNHTFLSAGWESSVLLYDMRCGNVPQRQFQGPRISGDGIDIAGNLLACASDRLTDQLQFFDFGSGQKIGQDVSFSSSLFAVRLATRKGNPVAWISGSKENMVSCVDIKSRQVISSVTHLDEAMFTLDVNADRPGLVYAGGGAGSVYRITVIE